MKVQVPKKYFTHKFERDKSHKEPVRGIVDINIMSVAEEILGGAGRLISQSKSGYRNNHQDHLVYFNACVFLEDGTEVWFGDLDLTLDTEKLHTLANKLGETLAVTPEHPFRYDGLKETCKKSSHDNFRVKWIKPNNEDTWAND